MAMPITEDQVAALRALLAGDFEEHKRLRALLDRDGARAGYLALIEAGCFEAVDRRFPKGTVPADVIGFVAEARAQSEDLGEELDPRAAERIIRAVLGDGSIDGMDDKTRFATELALLGVLAADGHLDGARLDEFLDQVRALAETWVS